MSKISEKFDHVCGYASIFGAGLSTAFATYLYLADRPIDRVALPVAAAFIFGLAGNVAFRNSERKRNQRLVEELRGDLHKTLTPTGINNEEFSQVMDNYGDNLVNRISNDSR